MKLLRSRAALGALGLAGVLALALPALARPGHGGYRGPGSSWHGPCDLERRVERLDLEPAVREQVFAILDESRVADRSLRARMREAHEAMRELLDAETPDLDAVMAQADRLGALHTEKHKQMLRTMLQLREQVGPERWAELREHRHRHGKGHGWKAGGTCDDAGDAGER